MAGPRRRVFVTGLGLVSPHGGADPAQMFDRIYAGESAVRKVFDLTPRGIIESLHLLRPIYEKTAAYGHFGRSEEEFSWEKTNRVDELRSAVGAIA